MRERVVAENVKSLILDDDRIQGEYLKHLLNDSGIRAILVSDPDDCIAELKEDVFDIIFIDYLMPKANGISVFHGILSELGGGFSTPAILLDNDITESFGREIFRTGFTNFLEKPVERECLDAVLYLYLPKDRITMKRERHSLQGRNDGIIINNVKVDQDLPDVPDWLFEAKGVSAEDGVKNCGSAESYLSALKIFYDSIEQKSNEIEEFRNTGNIPNYTIWVHALKSSARIVGISSLSEKAKALEDAGNRNDTELIENSTDELLAEYRSYLDILAPIGDDKERSDLPEVPADVLKDAYDSLRGFVDLMDYDLCEMVLHSMDEYKLSPADEIRMKELSKRLLDVDWEGMKELLE